MKVQCIKLSMLLAVMIMGSSVKLSAQDQQVTQEAQNSSSISEEQFISKNIKDNKKEAEMAQMALQKSENENIKAVAEILVEHHTQMAEDLSKLPGAENNDENNNVSADNDANGNNNNNNTTPSAAGDTGTASNQLDITGDKTSKDLDSAEKTNAMAAQTGGATDPQSMLTNASGDEFDSLWVKHMLIQHKIKLGELHQAKKAVSDPKLQEIIQEAIPTVREHRDMLTDIQQNPDEPVKIRGKHHDDKVAKKKNKKATTHSKSHNQ